MKAASSRTEFNECSAGRRSRGLPLSRPRTVEPGRQVLALHAVVLLAQVPQDDWLRTQEVVERGRVQLLICRETNGRVLLRSQPLTARGQRISEERGKKKKVNV